METMTRHDAILLALMVLLAFLVAATGLTLVKREQLLNDRAEITRDILKMKGGRQ